MLKPTTCLAFASGVEAAVDHYITIFPNSRIVRTVRAPAGIPIPEGDIMLIELELDGVPLLALNGGPHFEFTDACSLSVECETQQEIDDLWDKLVDGGRPVQCGWLVDRHGLSWQVVPKQMRALMSDADPARAARVAIAMMKMVKLDLAALEAAARMGEA